MATLTEIKNARDAYLTAKLMRSLCPVGSDKWCEAADVFIVARDVLLTVAREHFVETAPNEGIRAAAQSLYSTALGENPAQRGHRVRDELVDMLLTLDCG